MIEVTFVVLGKDVSRTARVDPDRPLTRIKADFINALKKASGGMNLGSPEDWDIAILPKPSNVPFAQYSPNDGDTLLLLAADSTAASSVSLN